MTTTYVLGAGASRDAGYPFAKDMGRGLLDWMSNAAQSGPFDFRAVAAFLRESCENAEDIEVLLAWMQDAISHKKTGSFEARTLASQILNNFRPALLQAMREWFEEILLSPSSTYHAFANQVVAPGDTVITFNYDVSLDRELRGAGRWDLGDGYGFDVEGFRGDSQVKLLKLHGSINWRPLLFGGPRGGGGAVVGPYGPLGRRPVFIDPDLNALGYEGKIDSSLPRAGGALLEMLILPVRDKEFFFATNFGSEALSFWDDLWRSATQALRSSNRIVICGYSVLPIDERACEMLLEDPEIKASFEVCCGSDSNKIVERLRLYGRDAHVADQIFFGDWVTANSSE